MNKNVKELVKKIKKARFVWICGNGGSAATAEHFTADLFSKGIRAICLNSNVSLLTMLANDYEYRSVFYEQLKVYANKEDLLITISCSGTSENIDWAINQARVIGMDIYSFETFFENKDYESLEDKHLQFCHQIKKLL